MKRRQFNQVSVTALGLCISAAYQQAYAISLADLTEKDASAGLKTALERGALTAVSLLGRADGFLGNPLVRIPLPGFLEDAASLMKKLGQGKKLDDLVTSMNRGAEQAVPFAKDLLVSAIKGMSVTDAKNIVSGGDMSVTRFFADKTRSPLGAKFLPVVAKATEKVGLAQKYNAVAGKASSLGLVKKGEANIEQYVTSKSLDGLYLMIGEEEKKIRKDPVGTGSEILKKVFGVLK